MSSPMIYNKIMPHANDLEDVVLGALLCDPDAISEVADILRPENFYNSVNGIVYGTILKMFAKGFPVDLITVVENLQKDGNLENVGGAYALTQMQGRVGSSAHIQTHAHIIVQKWMLRQMIVSTAKLQELAFDNTTDVFDLMEIAEKSIFEITNVANIGAPKHVLDIATSLIKRCNDIKSGDKTASGIPSGYGCVNRCIVNYGKSDLIIVAARPAMGKTSYVVGDIVEQARIGVPVLFFSHEMSSEQIMARMISYITEIEVNTILKSLGGDEEWLKINTAVSEIAELPIFIDDSSPNPVQIASKARRAKMQHDIGIVYIDYIQIIPHYEKGRQKNDEISYISGSLKRLAKDLNIPVIALSQLSRDCERRGGDKRPMLSDLRDSGSLEQDADMVMFLYRGEYYGFMQDAEGNSLEGMGEVIVSKNRNGATGTIDMGWKKHCAKYYDPAENNGYKF